MALHTDVYSDADLPAPLRELITAWQLEAFPAPEVDKITWARPGWHTIMFVEDEPVSYVGIFFRTGFVDGFPVKLGGIGSVVTPPPQRHRGYSSAAMARSAAFMRDELGAALGVLVTGDEQAHFYERLGWQVIDKPLVFRYPDGSKGSWGAVTMVLPLQEGAWTGGEIDVRGLPW